MFKRRAQHGIGHPPAVAVAAVTAVSCPSVDILGLQSIPPQHRQDAPRVDLGIRRAAGVFVDHICIVVVSIPALLAGIWDLDSNQHSALAGLSGAVVDPDSHTPFSATRADIGDHFVAEALEDDAVWREPFPASLHSDSSVKFEIRASHLIYFRLCQQWPAACRGYILQRQRSGDVYDLAVFTHLL